MSLRQMQEAMALLIRLPDSNRGENLGPFLSGFNLTPVEKDTIKSLSQDPLVAKYGRSMTGVRCETIQEQLPLSLRYLPPEIFDRIRIEWFEPVATKVPFGNVATTFIDFLLKDERARNALEETAAPFLTDILKFELAQVRFRREIMSKKTPPPAGSCLRHLKLLFVDLDHDIPEFIEQLDALPEEEKSTAIPAKRHLTLLLLPKEERPFCRYFEVDENVQRFVEGQPSASSLRDLIPEFYGDLVNLGLCRSLGTF